MKKLYRSDDRSVAGVCGGIAEYFDVDPTLIKLGWVIVTIMTGVVPGIIGYFVAAVVMPVKPDDKPKKKADKEV
jgi:phage shock protein C